MTIKELAAFLQVHDSTIRRLCRRGELPHFKIGDIYRFNRSRIDQWRLAREEQK